MELHKSNLERLPHVHPGEVLTLDFLEPMGLTSYALAIALGVPATRIHAITRGKRAITADTALRLGTYFGTTPQFWLNLQARYDLDVAQDAIAGDLARILPRSVSATAAAPRTGR